jgi:hypothetical protein
LNNKGFIGFCVFKENRGYHLTELFLLRSLTLTYSYIKPVAQFKVEYLLWEFEKFAISVSISETIHGIQMFFMPPVISIGILF